MSLNPAAATYARALADLLPEAAELERAAEAVRRIAEAAVEDPLARLYWRSASVSRDEKRELLERLATGVGAPETVHPFLMVLLRNNRAADLPEIADALDEAVAQRMGRIRATVTAAKPLEESEQQALRARLSKMTGKDVHLKVELDEALLGGVRVRMENRILDGSVRGKLDALVASIE